MTACTMFSLLYYSRYIHITSFNTEELLYNEDNRCWCFGLL